MDALATTDERDLQTTDEDRPNDAGARQTGTGGDRHIDTGENRGVTGDGQRLGDSVGGSPVTVESGAVRATLLGVTRVRLSEFVYAHQLGGDTRSETRPVAMFDVENTSDRPVCWQSGRTTFIGDDDYTYGESTLSLDPSRLGPGCHTRRVEIEPGRRARVVTLVERLPDTVEVAEIVHTLAARDCGDTQRLVFSVA